MALEEEGYQVEAVSSTREALEKLAGGRYSLVVSDIYIDDRTGLDILNAAKAATSVHRRPDVRRGSMETVMQATRGGAFDYLAKPFEIDDLSRCSNAPRTPSTARPTRSSPKSRWRPR